MSEVHVLAAAFFNALLRQFSLAAAMLVNEKEMFLGELKVFMFCNRFDVLAESVFLGRRSKRHNYLLCCAS